MRLSPPLAVLGILAVAVVGLGLATPKDHPVSAQAVATRVTVELPTKTYNALALHVKDRNTAHGDTLTVARWIADLTERTLAVPPETPRPRDASPARDGRN